MPERKDAPPRRLALLDISLYCQNARFLFFRFQMRKQCEVMSGMDSLAYLLVKEYAKLIHTPLTSLSLFLHFSSCFLPFSSFFNVAPPKKLFKFLFGYYIVLLIPLFFPVVTFPYKFFHYCFSIFYIGLLLHFCLHSIKLNYNKHNSYNQLNKQ